MRSFYNIIIKRIIDFCIAFFVLIIVSPLLVIIALLIWFKFGNPIFFTHIRPGKNDSPFKMIKFRTMTNQTDKFGKLLPNFERRTRFGDFLRNSSIDELPELINVLKGEMSIVGPRPLEMRYLQYYTKDQRKRHRLKPGITGWAQVNGRNAISWEDKFKFDVWYVDNLSIWLDIKIIFSTIKKVIVKEGINVDSENTVIPFDVYLKNKNKKNL